MNAFDVAGSLGLDQEKIMEFLGKANPQIGDALQKALAAGYTADQAFDFLKKQFSGAKVDAKMARRVYGMTNEATVTRRARNSPEEKKTTLAPAIGGLVGAGIGALTGGPVGAAVGGAAGYKQMQKLGKAYEEHVNAGGQIPFLDFVTELAKGGAVAGIAGAQIGPLKEAAAKYLSGAKEKPKTEDIKQAVQDLGETLEGDQKRQYDFLDKRGLNNRIMTMAKSGKSKEEIVEFLKKKLPMMDQEYLRSIGFTGKEGNLDERLSEMVDLYLPKQNAPQEQSKQEEVTQEKVSESPQIQKPKDIGIDFESVFQPPEDTKNVKSRKIEPFKNALKSSNIAGATFDQETGQARVAFKPKGKGDSGTVYEYENIDLDTFEKMTGGKAKPITEGSNKFGVWFGTKDPSRGAAFHKFIKTNKEKFPYTKVEPKGWSVDEKNILQAERTFLASEIFEPFAKERLKGRQKARGKGLKDVVPALREIDDDYLFDIVEYLEEKLKSKMKSEPKVSRLATEVEKEFL